MRKIAYIIIIIGLVVMINGLLHSIYDLWHKQDLVTSAQKELALQQQKNQKFRAEYATSQTEGFVEQQARDKLFLVKPGEQDVLFSQKPQDFIQSNSAANIPNWKQWLNLFF